VVVGAGVVVGESVVVGAGVVVTGAVVSVDSMVSVPLEDELELSIDLNPPFDPWLPESKLLDPWVLTDPLKFGSAELPTVTSGSEFTAVEVVGTDVGVIAE